MYIVGFCICILCCSHIHCSCIVARPATHRAGFSSQSHPEHSATWRHFAGRWCGRRIEVWGEEATRSAERRYLPRRSCRRTPSPPCAVSRQPDPHSPHSARSTSVPPSSGASPCPLAHTDAIPTAGDYGRRKERNSHGEAYHPVKISWPLHLK